MSTIDWKDPAIAPMRAEWLNRIKNEIGSRWLEMSSDEELNHFLSWAAQGQVYFYPGHNEKLGDAFRGYVTGCRFQRELDSKAWAIFKRDLAKALNEREKLRALGQQMRGQFVLPDESNDFPGMIAAIDFFEACKAWDKAMQEIAK